VIPPTLTYTVLLHEWPWVDRAIQCLIRRPQMDDLLKCRALPQFINVLILINA
jgi:hypothetical protein